MVQAGVAWLDAFPALARLPTEARQRLLADGREVRLDAGTTIFGPGQSPPAYLLVLAGTVLVRQTSETGREIALYRVAAGESCALTTVCLLGDEAYQAEGVAESDVLAVAIPRTTFDALIAQSSEFRKFVFTAFSARIANLFRLIEDVAFQRLDIRLAQKLIERADAGGAVAATHRQLAAELGTAREVVSRILHEFQVRGWISPGRGSLQICNRTAISVLAAER